MQATFTLRRFKPSDLERVMQINQTCLPENYTPFFFMNLYQRFPETFIVAVENGEVVGYTMCRIETGIPSFRFIGITKKGHVISIAVLPQNQRQGIGYALIREAMRAMMNYKAKECYLEVRTSNIQAVDLYRKMRFETVRTIRGYYADGEDAYIMATKLPFMEH